MIAAVLVLVAVVALVQWRMRPPPTQGGQQREVAAQGRAATPAHPITLMLSSAIPQALEGVLDMEPSEAVRLEERLAAHPHDFNARVKLMAYLRRADRETVPGEREKRWKLAVWMIEHQPESQILSSYVAQFSARDLTDESMRQAERLWEAAIHNNPGDAALLWNAACFFQNLSPGLHLSYLEATAEANPNHPQALRPLALLYAEALRAGTAPLVARAERGLEKTKNVWVLGNAAYYLQGFYNQTVTMRAPDERLSKLAERYFSKAQAIDPNLDRQAILPRLDPPKREQGRIAVAPEQTAFDKAAEKIRRLGVDSFPQLPATVSRVLRSRGCSVPQPAAEARARSGMANVIRGEFIVRGEAGWAVLCSVNRTSTVLVFRNDSDTHPQAMFSSEDRNYLQGLGGDVIGYSREITAVNRAFMLRNYRAYGGEKPPPIDHHGIDDAFLGKASATMYFYRGRWMYLQGAD